MIPTARAQIAIRDGSPLTITHTIGNSLNQTFTVTDEAKAMVVILEDKSANLPEAATLIWNGQTLTRDILAIYHLFNAVAGTANITGTLAVEVSDTELHV